MFLLLSFISLTVAAELQPSSVCSDRVCSPEADAVAPPGGLVMLQAKARLHDKSATLQSDTSSATCKCKSPGGSAPNNGYECSDGTKGYCPSVAMCSLGGDWASPKNQSRWDEICVQMPQTICGNQALTTGHKLMSSTGKAFLKMQGDGNLVLHKNSGEVLWATNKFPGSGSKVVMQDDCNVVVYGSDGKPHWDLKTDENLLDKIKNVAKHVVKTVNKLKDSDGVEDAFNKGKAAISGPTICKNRARDAGVCLKVQDDCNLVVYSSEGGVEALWSSKTSC